MFLLNQASYPIVDCFFLRAIFFGDCVCNRRNIQVFQLCDQAHVVLHILYTTLTKQTATFNWAGEVSTVIKGEKVRNYSIETIRVMYSLLYSCVTGDFIEVNHYSL